MNRYLTFFLSNFYITRSWKEEFDRAMATEGKVWVESKRFHSFAPPRKNSTAKW